MTDYLPIEPDATSLELDPVGYMATVLYRAKAWLQEAQNIDDVRSATAIAVGFESVIREKKMANDAQMAATEVVRRCDRRVGELVRARQEEGTVRPPKDIPARDGRTHGYDPLPAPAEFFSTHKEQTDSYILAGAGDEEFDQAIEEAKAEGNLSRANLVRKVKGEMLEDQRAARHKPGGSKFFNAVIEEAEAVMKAAAENPEAFGDLDERADRSGGVKGARLDDKRAVNRQPLADQFFNAVYDLTKAAERVGRLAADDRFDQNSNSIAARHCGDLIRVRDALEGIINRLESA